INRPYNELYLPKCGFSLISETALLILAVDKPVHSYQKFRYNPSVNLLNFFSISRIGNSI
ncbi:hypothetical protein, partial [Testudinibacter sp. TR-2022]|uniref:hypothetical protein n=1 Tax=Testudinibacter sp. TR-2022 TaxID=2585029 RepID=UPI00227867AD